MTFKKVILIFLPLIISLFLSSAEKSNIAVANFDAQNVSLSEAAVVADFIRSDLVKMGKFRVIDRQNMEVILAEQGLQQTGCTTNECAVKLGEILNVERIIVGKLVKLFQTYYVMADMIDVETGEIVLSHKVSTEDPKTLDKEAEKMAYYFASGGRKEIPEAIQSTDRFPVIVEIRKKEIRDERNLLQKKEILYFRINRGKLDGMKERNIYDVWRAPDKLWRRKVGKVIITRVREVESEGELIQTTKDEDVKIGDALIYWARRKMWSAGVKGWGNEYNDNLMTRVSFGYFEYIGNKNWGIDLEMGKAEKMIISGYKHIKYDGLLFLKYHINYDYSFSQYLGIGISRYSKFEHTPIKHEFYHKLAFPILNAGLDLFSNRFFHIIFDLTYFQGADKIEGLDTDFLAASVGASINW
ncbi:MAG TPA: CsgG/HfaB family protein [bacterium]|nr:CsgG/HfaB family protein [bacterium]